MSEPTTDQAEPCATEARSRALIVFEDVGDEIHVAGLMQPEQFDPTLASHVLGRWIGENIAMLAKMARADAQAKEALAAAQSEQTATGQSVLIGPDRERTIVSTGGEILLPGTPT